MYDIKTPFRVSSTNWTKKTRSKQNKKYRLLLAESVIIKVQLSQRPIIKKCHVKSCSSIGATPHQQSTARNKQTHKLNRHGGAALVISILQELLNKQTSLALFTRSLLLAHTHTHTNK